MSRHMIDSTEKNQMSQSLMCSAAQALVPVGVSSSSVVLNGIEQEGSTQIYVMDGCVM